MRIGQKCYDVRNNSRVGWFGGWVDSKRHKAKVARIVGERGRHYVLASDLRRGVPRTLEGLTHGR